MLDNPLPRFALFDSFGDRRAFDGAVTLEDAIRRARQCNIAGDVLIADRATGHVVADAVGPFITPAIVANAPAP